MMTGNPTTPENSPMTELDPLARLHMITQGREDNPPEEISVLEAKIPVAISHCSMIPRLQEGATVDLQFTPTRSVALGEASEGVLKLSVKYSDSPRASTLTIGGNFIVAPVRDGSLSIVMTSPAHNRPLATAESHLAKQAA